MGRSAPWFVEGRQAFGEPRDTEFPDQDGRVTVRDVVTGCLIGVTRPPTDLVQLAPEGNQRPVTINGFELSQMYLRWRLNGAAGSDRDRGVKSA
jgi:hypothetical protein